MASDRDQWVDLLGTVVENHPIKFRHGEWKRNSMWVAGKQYHHWNESTGFVAEVMLRRNTRCIYNFIRPDRKTYAAKMLRDDPQPKAMVPEASTDLKEQKAVHAANKWLSRWWARAGMKQIMWQVVKDGFDHGMGVVFWRWDDEKGASLEDAGSVGDFRVERAYPGEVYPDPTSGDPDAWRWVVRDYLLPIREAERRFGQAKGSFDDAARSSMADEPEEEYVPLFGHRSRAINEDSEMVQKVRIRELWRLSDGSYPGGLHVVVLADGDSGGRLVLKENFESDVLPIGVFLVEDGVGYVTQLVPLQRDYNRMHSLIQESAAWTGQPKWFVHNATQIKANALKHPGVEIVTYSGDKPPELRQGTMPPPAFMGLPDAIEAVKRRTSGHQEISAGVMPYRSNSQTSGSALGELKQAEEMRFSEDVSGLTEMVRNIAFACLEAIQNNMAAEAMAAIVSPEDIAEFQALADSNLKSGVDIQVDLGSGFQTGSAEKFQMLMTAMQAGVQVPPEVSLNVISGYFGNFEMAINQMLAYRKKGERILGGILSGNLEIAEPGEFDDFNAYAQVFREYMATADYEQQPREVRGAINNFLAQCMAIQQQQMMAAMGQPMVEPPQQGGAPEYVKQGQERIESPLEQEEAQANLHQSPGAPVLPENIG